MVEEDNSHPQVLDDSDSDIMLPPISKTGKKNPKKKGLLRDERRIFTCSVIFVYDSGKHDVWLRRRA